MGNVVARAWAAYRLGGRASVRGHAAAFARRRYFRVRASIDRISAIVEKVEAPAEIIAGYTYKALVRVRNTSRVVWNADGQSSQPFSVAANLRSEDGAEIEGNHTILPARFGPGESRDVQIRIQAPARPGRYRLVVDCVREGCYWFSDLGTQPADMPIEVEPARAEVDPVDLPSEIVAGCMYRLKVKVRNCTRSLWNAPEGDGPSFSILWRLRSATGEERDGPLIPLGPSVMPGETCDIDLLLEPPRKPGDYVLGIDLLQSNDWSAGTRILAREHPLRISPHSATLLANRIPALDVTMDITNKCPLKCIQCRKTYFETFDEQQDMNWDHFKRVAEQIFPHARAVMLSSAGEPLMTRNFLDAIELTKSYGVEDISFISSGMHLNRKRAERIVDLGVSRVEFSLDGASAEVYNKIRVGSNFDKVIEHIQYLSDYKKKCKALRPVLRFNWVLMRSNIHELPAFIDLAERLGVEEVQCQHMVAFVEAIRNEALVYDKERSNYFVAAAKERAAAYGIRFYHPPLFDVNGKGPVTAEPLVAIAPATSTQNRPLDRTLDGGIYSCEDAVSFERKTHPAMDDGQQLCTDPWRKIYLDWQGMVYPCCMWKEEPLGDIRKNTFEEIWCSERYQKLREGLTVGPLGKSCAECTAITGGDINSERSYLF